MKPDWFPDWSDSVCAVVASGESVSSAQVAQLQGRCRVIVINNSFQLAPWADVLYAADERWWDYYPKSRDFAGLKVTPDVKAAKRHGLKLISLLDETDRDSDRIMVDNPGKIGRGGNSGFQTINLATQFGAKRQIWLGFDFVGEHWHEKHPSPLKNPRQRTLDKWCKRLDAQAEILGGLGVEVVNSSASSALTAYPKMEIEAALQHFSVFERCAA